MFAFPREIVTIAASESPNPAQQISRATRSVVWRVCLFYIGSIFLIAALVRRGMIRCWASRATLTRARTLELLVKPGAQFLMNLVVLTSVSSCLVSAHYTASRMLYSLAPARRRAGHVAAHARRSGIPVHSVIAPRRGGAWPLINFVDFLRPKMCWTR